MHTPLTEEHNILIKPESVVVVVPCYNESANLDMDTFREFRNKYSFVFVNDGSTDTTLDVLNKHKSDSMDVMDLATNGGKGEAVRQGMLRALEKYPDADWIGYLDADLAVSLEEIDLFFIYAGTLFPEAEGIFGSRVRRLGSDIRRSVCRHIVGRFFATLFRILFGVRTYDSQCGAKFFRPASARAIFEKPFFARWLFDLEVLFRSDQSKLVEYPLRKWHDGKGSKVMSFKSILWILSDMVKLKMHY